jgi:hypothetical protein
LDAFLIDRLPFCLEVVKLLHRQLVEGVTPPSSLVGAGVTRLSRIEDARTVI